MLAGPECSRCVAEFETVLCHGDKGHHAEARALQIKCNKTLGLS